MKELSPRVLHVSQDNSKGNYPSITKASEDAGEGDQIIVSSGTYSYETTNEKFPIYLPPKCQLQGSGPDTCKINGDSIRVGGPGYNIKVEQPIHSRPVDPYQSLILLGDNTTLSGFTIENAPANAVSNEQGANITITNNTIQKSGQHGLLIFGANNAMIQKNQFKDNGTRKEEYKPPRSTVAGRQGHQIFVESRVDSKNNINIIENILDKTFADGIAIDIFDQPDGAEMNLKVVNNKISNCGRNGFSMAGSYGPSDSKVKIEIKNNKILSTENTAIDLQSSFSLIFKSIKNSDMSIDIIENEIDECKIGIDAYGSFSPSENGHLECNIIKNSISNTKEFGIRATGGIGMDDWHVINTKYEGVIENNTLLNTGEIPILIQGGDAYGSNPELVKNNELSIRLSGNRIDESKKIIVKDGLPTNHARIFENSQQYYRE